MQKLDTKVTCLVIDNSGNSLEKMYFKFEKLEVWNLSKKLILEVYRYTESLPLDERFNLVSQARRAATSVSLNIAEGSTGLSDAEQVKFLNYSNRSLLEVVAAVLISVELQYVERGDIEDLLEHCRILSSKIQAMKKSLSRKKT